MRLTAPIPVLKQQAKRRAKAEGVPLHRALDAIAQAEGFAGWSHLASRTRPAPATRILPELRRGDLLLLGARPGQGKTMLGLDLALAAHRAGWRSSIFTLEDTAATLGARLTTLGATSAELEGIAIDASDGMEASHIAAAATALPAPALAVIDYLQILDQRRESPEIGTQIAALAAAARREGTVFVVLSQIDRSFDGGVSAVPTLADVRMPNRFDLSRFTATCFLHGPDILFDRQA